MEKIISKLILFINNLDKIQFFYWISGIITPIIIGGIYYKYMKKIKDIKIHQKAKKMQDVKGADFTLTNGEDLHIEKMMIDQDAGQMDNVTGLSFKVNGQQSARLQDVKIKQTGSQVIISDNPNVKVEINKQN